MLVLNQFEKLLSALQAPALAVHPEYCSRLRHRLSECTLCSDNCPTRAIEWSEGVLDVSPESCTSCGVCSTVCPNGVFESIKPNDMEILERARELLLEQRDIVFECNPDRIERQGKTITVPCLGRLNEGLLVGCIALGAERVYLSPGECQECRVKSGIATAREVVTNSIKLLDCFGLGDRISLKRMEGSSIEPRVASRREFFTSLAKGAKTSGSLLAANIIGSIKENPPRQKGSLPVSLPFKRRMLIGSLRKLGMPVVEMIESPLFCQFEITDECIGCQMCAFFCPAGALIKMEEEGKLGVVFKPSYCAACGLCRDICFKNAVTLSGSVSLSKVISRSEDTFIMRDGPITARDKNIDWKSILGIK